MRLMNSEDTALLRQLLAQRVLSLGVLVDGAPYVGLLPFAVTEDRRALLVHASELARHSRGLGDGAPWSGLVHLPDDPAGDPLQVGRVTLSGAVRRLQDGTREHEAAKARFLARFPDSEQTFELADFGLYALEVREGRLVAGFARARNVSADDLEAAR
jgi:heme oxygenase (biliverdin-IX-beta and delta-forming)